MRVLGKIKRNKLTIHDKISGEDLTFYYRIPTTQERVEYSSKLFKKNKKGKYELDLEFKLKAGASILIGIEDNQFGDKEEKPISSNPVSPDYRKDWKELLMKDAPELIAVLADTVYDNVRVIDQPDLDFDEEEEKEIPLPTCSSVSSTDVPMSENKSV